jgi:RNA polymerase primary sigma factor
MQHSSSEPFVKGLKRQTLPSGENERLCETVRLGTLAVADLFLACLPAIAPIEREVAPGLDDEQRRLLSYLGFKRAVLDAKRGTKFEELMLVATAHVTEALKREPVESVPDYDIRAFHRQFVAAAETEAAPTEADATELIERAQEGQRVMGLIMRHNMCVVLHYVNRWPQMRHLWPDMISEGLIGFQKAILRFDAGRGYKLITFANDWVMQGISAFVSKHRRSVRVPVSTHAIMIKVMKVHVRLSQESAARGETLAWPDFPAIAAEAGLEESEVIKIFQVHASESSLDEQLLFATDERREPLGKTLPDDRPDQESVLLDAERTRIARGLFVSDTLTVQERSILHEHFANDRNLADISRDHLLSRERVRQIREGALEKLRVSIPAGIN